MPLITLFDPWKNKYCTCPAKLSLSPYTGCAHNCLYCYAASYIRGFSSPRPKKDFIKRLENEARKIPAGSIIAAANSSDPYQPMEGKLKLTRGMLLLFKNYNLKLNIVTKSILVLRDLDILRDIKNVVVSFTFTGADKKIARKLEPGCADNPLKKLKTISSLSKHIPVAVRLDPLIYPLNTKKIKETVGLLAACGVKQIITSACKIKPDNFKRMCSAFPEHASLWKTLYLEKGSAKGGYTYLADSLRKELIGEVKKSAEGRGLKFSSCREGFDTNTANCDGSSLFPCL